MRITNADSYVDLEFIEVTTVPYAEDTITLSVEAFAGGFSGKDESVWFGRQEIDRFLLELRQLEATRSGSAKLTDLSYGSDIDGMSLEIFTIDSAGHMALRVGLSKPRYVDNFQAVNHVSISFAIDSDWFLNIVSELETLFAESHRDGRTDLDALMARLPRKVRWADIPDFKGLDDRVPMANAFCPFTIGVNMGNVEWVPDHRPPGDLEKLTWAWVIRPDLSEAIAARAPDDFRKEIMYYVRKRR